MSNSQLSADLTAAQVMAQWPQTISVFFRHRMACVGCPVAHFEALSEITAVYRLDLACFIGELQRAVDRRKDD
jgi:hybrid cluster-associated redox disulfide protein